MKASVVLNSIWKRSEGSQVYLPIRYEGTWHEGDSYKVDEAQPVVEWMVNGPITEVDYYFTPLRFQGPRQKQHLGNPGVIFADIDDDSHSIPLEPSVLIESSPGHKHGYWFLRTPVPPREWAPVAKAWTQHIGADPAGWDHTQVLRIPFTRNTKYEGVHVRLLDFVPSREYYLDEFPRPRAPISVVSDEIEMPPLCRGRDHMELMISVWEELGLENQHWLTISEREVSDRSRLIWKVAIALLERGFTEAQTFQLLDGAGWNKYRNRPEALWDTVIKARKTLDRRAQSAAPLA